MGYVNLVQLRKDLNTSLKQLAPLARQSATIRFDGIKKQATEAFENSPVTKEIEEGVDANTQTLPKGNLFSFLGFYLQEANPIKDLRFELYSRIKLLPVPPAIQQDGARITYQFPTEAPTFEELKALTPLSWAAGRSWLEELEDGISGIGQYIFAILKPFPSPEPSHSSRGLQKGEGGGKTSPIPYLKGILKTLRERLNEGNI